MTRLWGGRFTSEPAPEMLAFTRSAHFDVRLAAQDCRVLAVHAQALAGAGVLTDDEAARTASATTAIAERFAAGMLAPSPDDEDVHTTVERALLEAEPSVGAKVRAGMSRNDRVATAFRLWIADAAEALAAHTAALRGVVEERASEHRDTVMPGYTHLQRAQPVTLAAHLGAHAAALARAEARLRAAGEAALAACPLGAGALAGTTLPIDRAASARALGFAAPAPNTIDAVADRDFVAEFLFACATIGIACSRLAEEVVLWTSTEFAFAELDDAWATGSSLMPQKRNPDVAELARGKTGRLIGDLTAALAMLKGLPLAYNRDLQEDKEPAFDAADTVAAMLPALRGTVATLRFDTARLRDAAGDGALLATDLAEYLVRKGVAFRDAHEAVGAAVRLAAERGVDLAAVDLATLQGIHEKFDADVVGVFDPVASVRSRLGAP